MAILTAFSPVRDYTSLNSLHKQQMKHSWSHTESDGNTKLAGLDMQGQLKAAENFHSIFLIKSNSD